jgi:hypothetical protein
MKDFPDNGTQFMPNLTNQKQRTAIFGGPKKN